MNAASVNIRATNRSAPSAGHGPAAATWAYIPPTETGVEALSRDVAAIRDSVSAFVERYGRDVDDFAEEIVQVNDVCHRVMWRAERMDAELFELRAAVAWHTHVLRALADGLGLSIEPDDYARREIATQVAYRVISADGILEHEARALGSPDELRSWAEEHLREMLTVTLMDNIDYIRLHARLR